MKPRARWKVERTDTPETPWCAWYTDWHTLDPNSDAASIDGGEHETWAEAFHAALEGAALTATNDQEV